jgi:hypothetical protein
MGTIRREPAERAVIFCGLAAGLTLERVNSMLEEVVGGRPLSQEGYERLRDAYLPAFHDDPGLLVEWLERPVPLGSLRLRGFFDVQAPGDDAEDPADLTCERRDTTPPPLRLDDVGGPVYR